MAEDIIECYLTAEFRVLLVGSQLEHQVAELINVDVLTHVVHVVEQLPQKAMLGGMLADEFAELQQSY